MGYAGATSTITGQVIDPASAEEFLVQIRAQASAPELSHIVAALEAKSTGFQRLLAGASRALESEELRAVLRSMFVSRRRADQILGAVGPERLAEAFFELAAADEPSAAVLRRFEEAMSPAGEMPFELPFEILHFTHPERFWLWTRWIFDPRMETGALRLLVDDGFELFGRDLYETYMKVGAALAFLHEHAQAAGMGELGGGAFTVDVLLACVYAVYMYTILRLRMTQEFNQIVPALPELVSRLLGVHRLEV